MLRNDEENSSCENRLNSNIFRPLMCQNKSQMTYSRSIVDSYMAFSNASSFPRHAECSVSAIADLVFLVDGSWSVGRENFKFIRSFIGAMAGAFDIGEDKTRVAVVQYSSDTRTEFNLNQYHRRPDVLRAIKNLPYKGGNTMTGMQKLCWSWNNSSEH